MAESKDKREPTVGDVLKGAEQGDPAMTRLAAEMSQRMAADKQRHDQAKEQLMAKTREITDQMDQQAALVAEARARAEAERVVREQATLDAISSIRALAEESAAASAAREAEGAEREARMVDLTDKLTTLTRVLVVLAVLTLAATIISLFA